jgi:hypothetical protein
MTLPTEGQLDWADQLNSHITNMESMIDGSLSWRLGASASIGQTTITIDKNPPNLLLNNGFVVIDPFTTEAELRRVSNISGKTLTLHTALGYNHAAGDLIFWFAGGLVPWSWWGAQYSSTAYAAQNVLGFNRLATEIYNLGTFYRGGILVPNGLYYINDRISPERDMILSGVNCMNSKIMATTDFPFDGTDDYCMVQPKRDGTLLTTGNLISSRWIFRDLYLDGNNVASSNGILSSPQQPDRTSDLRIDNCKRNGLHLIDVQQHIIKNYEAINCGIAFKMHACRFVWVDGFNAEQTDINAVYAYTKAGDGNCSRTSVFSNCHFESLDPTDGTWFLFDPTNASSPDDTGWVFENFHFSCGGTQTLFKFVGNTIPHGYTLRDIRGYGNPANVIALDDAYSGAVLNINQHFGDRIRYYIGGPSNYTNASSPHGIHEQRVRGFGGREVGLGVGRGTGGNLASRLFTRTVDDNENHQVGLDVNDVVKWLVNNRGKARAESFELTSGGPQILTGANSPEGGITAPVGSLYLRTGGGAGTTLYVKESGTGNTGWVAK